jgi:hypothetical protein
MNEFIQRLVQWVVDIYLDIQNRLLEYIAKLLKGDEDLLEANILEWQQKKLSQIQRLSQASNRIITLNAATAVARALEAIKKIGFKGIEENEAILNDALEQGATLTEPTIPPSDPIINNLLSVTDQRVSEILKLTHATILQQTEQIYRDIITKTVSEILAGNMTPHQALRSTIKQWADHGIPALIDRRGRRWSTEAYVGMVIRTTSNQVTNEMQDTRFDSWDVDLVEISSHIGSRPLCAPYQGKIFSRSGQHGRFPALSSTSIGQPAGLFGINCGHVQYPYIQGISRETYNIYPKKENDEIYQQSQVQRKLERDIRKAKTELLMMEELGDQEGIDQSKSKVRQRQSKMRQFINESGRTRRRNREQIVTP